MQQERAQRGFTVIELMMVVAIIAVLAVIVIPSFVRDAKRAGNKSEVHPMFAELGTREEQYKTENGLYLAAAACPASASSAGTDVTKIADAPCALTAGQPWVLLRVQPSESLLKCSYTVSIGGAGTNPSTDPLWPTWPSLPASLAPAAPALSWYFVVATCTDTGYFTASWDSKIRSEDGK